MPMQKKLTVTPTGLRAELLHLDSVWRRGSGLEGQAIKLSHQIAIAFSSKPQLHSPAARGQNRTPGEEEETKGSGDKSIVPIRQHVYKLLVFTLFLWKWGNKMDDLF